MNRLVTLMIVSIIIAVAIVSSALNSYTMTPVACTVNGTTLTTDESDALAEIRPYSIMLRNFNCKTEEQTCDLIKQIKNASPHTMISIDIECRIVNRLKDFMPLEYTTRDFEDKSSEYVYKYWLSVAQDVKKLGIDIVFGPVTDICNDGNSFLYKRTFSGNHDTVVKLSIANARAWHKAGIMPIIKHLPGHGIATSDSHKTLPVADASRKEIEDECIAPNKKIVEALEKYDVSFGAMVSHVKYSCIDSENPASLSPDVINVIRKDIGIGTREIFSDEISMGALNGIKDIEKKLLEAGCNIIITNQNIKEIDKSKYMLVQ